MQNWVPNLHIHELHNSKFRLSYHSTIGLIKRRNCGAIMRSAWRNSYSNTWQNAETMKNWSRSDNYFNNDHRDWRNRASTLQVHCHNQSSLCRELHKTWAVLLLLLLAAIERRSAWNWRKPVATGATRSIEHSIVRGEAGSNKTTTNHNGSGQLIIKYNYKNYMPFPRITRRRDTYT